MLGGELRLRYFPKCIGTIVLLTKEIDKARRALRTWHSSSVRYLHIGIQDTLCLWANISHQFQARAHL